MAAQPQASVFMSVPFDPAQHQASTVCLPPGNWATVLDCLCDHFKAISREQWLDRIARGRVLDARGAPIDLALAYKPGLRIHYFREVPNEKPIPVQEHVLHIDEHLVVADKPHFLPVTPTGEYVEHTLLRRLIRRLDNPHLVPLHRIDRHTAGLVLFSANPQTRSAYQRLFPERRIDKRYQAIAAAMPLVKAFTSGHVACGFSGATTCNPLPPDVLTNAASPASVRRWRWR